MAPKRRRFLVINYWVGAAASAALIGPVLVSTADYRHFHFCDELDAAILEPGDYEIIKLYPLGYTFDEAQARFGQEFQSDMAMEWLLLDPAAPFLRWAGIGQQLRQPCLAA